MTSYDAASPTKAPGAAVYMGFTLFTNTDGIIMIDAVTENTITGSVFSAAVDENGKAVDVADTAFIWEIENRDAFKDVGTVFSKLSKMKRLPVQHSITGNTEERKLPNGNSFYLPVVSLDLTKTLELGDVEQTNFGDFMAWVQNYNEYIINAWSEKAMHEGEDIEGVDDIVDIEFEDEEVA